MAGGFIGVGPVAEFGGRGDATIRRAGRTGSGRVGGEDFFAIDNVCKHSFTYLTDGWLIPEARTVQCPLHESCFDLATGESTPPPAEVPVNTYEIRLEGLDGFVRIE